MAVIELASGAVTILANGSQPTVVVGTTPFSDHDDATHVTVYGSSGSPTPPRGEAVATLDTLTDPGSVTDIILTLRASANAAATSGGLDWVEVLNPDMSQTFLGFAFGVSPLPLDGAIHEVVVSAAEVATNIFFDPSWLVTWAAALRSGGMLLHVGSTQGLNSTPAPDMSLTFYSFTVEVITDTVEPPAGKPFRRVWPREHGRIWPPPRHQHGRRTVGGYL